MKLENPLFNIVLVEPEIHVNTGNIGRTSVGTQCRLHLVEPLGFEITDSRVKRAGLDYWGSLDLTIHSNFEALWSCVEDKSRAFFFTTKVEKTLYDFEFHQGDWLFFGKETKGLDMALIERFRSQAATIPMPGEVRSLNLANAVSITVFEGMRQLRFS